VEVVEKNICLVVHMVLVLADMVVEPDEVADMVSVAVVHMAVELVVDFDNVQVASVLGIDSDTVAVLVDSSAEIGMAVVTDMVVGCIDSDGMVGTIVDMVAGRIGNSGLVVDMMEVGASDIDSVVDMEDIVAVVTDKVAGDMAAVDSDIDSMQLVVQMDEPTVEYMVLE
jgi:hypothetical protein